MPRVEVVHWNPPRKVFGGKLGRIVPVRRPANNFGDLIGPRVVELVLATRGIDEESAPAPGRLLTVGSILHYARDGDHVWGSGVNGKVDESAHAFGRLDVRAVRGPRTRDFLLARGVAVPEVFGDPALLLPSLDDRLRRWSEDKRHDLTVVPNFHDVARYGPGPDVQSPTAPLDTVLERIARSRMVVGSSLHGIVVAESLGIPARVVAPGREAPFKYEDYYLGTGRGGYAPAASVREAVDAGGEPPLGWAPDDLLAAFPWDLWQPRAV